MWIETLKPQGLPQYQIKNAQVLQLLILLTKPFLSNFCIVFLGLHHPISSPMNPTHPILFLQQAPLQGSPL